jgi:DNA recombination protein RmuC
LNATVIIVGLIALGLGALIGWLFASRESAGAKQTVENLRLQLDEVARERDSNRDAVNELAQMRAAQDEREKSFLQQIEALREAKESLSAQFHDIGSKFLGEARKAFLEQAGERFTQVVTPVETLLKTYQEKLQTIEKERVDHYAGLREAVELVRTGQGQVRDETRPLVNTLRASPKARGRWGEQSLKNVLEQAGLSPYADFRTEVSVDGADGKLRPDVVVRLPGGRQLIIDAKCSLNSYLDASEELDDKRRAILLKQHASSIKNHVQQLGSKRYWSEFGDAADYVVMFIPGEHFLTAALDSDGDLWDWAFDKRVLLATPTNLVAIARTVSVVWQQEKLATEAAQIAALGKELHSRLASMAGHVVRLGRNLELSNRAYNQMVGSLDTQVLTQAKRFESLGAGSGKSIDDLPVVETTPRDLRKLSEGPAGPIHDEQNVGDKTRTDA